MVLTTVERLEARTADFQAFYRAWTRAVEWRKTNEAEGDAIMAGGVGGWLKEADVFKETRSGVEYYDGAMNEAFIGTAEMPGTITRTIGNRARPRAGGWHVRPRPRARQPDRLRRRQSMSPAATRH